MWQILYAVIEVFDDNPSEPFGDYLSDKILRVGDIIQLRWLDGTPAYKVKVLEIDHCDRIKVKAIK